MQLMYQVVIGLDVAEAALNPTPGDSNGVDQDLYEQNGNDWIRWFLRLALSNYESFNASLQMLKPFRPRENYPGINFILSASISTQNP